MNDDNERSIKDNYEITEISSNSLGQLIISNCPNLKVIDCPSLQILRASDCDNLSDINKCKFLNLLRLINCKNIKDIPENNYIYIDIENCILIKNFKDIKKPESIYSFHIINCPFFQSPYFLAEDRTNSNNSFYNRIMYAMILHKIKKIKKMKIKNKLNGYMINDLISVILLYI
jgi:hypothetical protein